MKRFMIELVLILVVLLIAASCGSEPLPAPAEESPDIQPGDPVDEPYPGPDQDGPAEDTAMIPKVNPYPEPQDLTPAEPGVVVIPMDHEYAPAPGDDQLTRGNVFIEESGIILLESYPVQVKLQLIGNLPTPCHQLRAVVSPPEDNNHIQVGVYSLSDPDLMCTQVLEPFIASIPLGRYTEGSLKFYVKVEVIGDIELP